MSNPEINTDHLRDDVSATAGQPESGDSQIASGESLTIGGQLGELPSETPVDTETDDDADETGDLNPSDLDGSAADIEQEVRENGAP